MWSIAPAASFPARKGDGFGSITIRIPQRSLSAGKPVPEHAKKETALESRVSGRPGYGI